jgi:hypothetical protein
VTPETADKVYDWGLRGCGFVLALLALLCAGAWIVRLVRAP